MLTICISINDGPSRKNRVNCFLYSCRARHIYCRLHLEFLPSIPWQMPEKGRALEKRARPFAWRRLFLVGSDVGVRCSDAGGKRLAISVSVAALSTFSFLAMPRGRSRPRSARPE